MENLDVKEEILEKAEIADSPIPPKKGRGRPKKDQSQKTEAKAETKEHKQTIPTKALCYPLVKGISMAGVLVLKDKRAEMNMTEAEFMAEGMAQVFDKHLPALLGQYGAEIVLLTAFTQYGARLTILSKQIKAEKQREWEAQQHQQPQAGPQQEPEPFSSIVN